MKFNDLFFSTENYFSVGNEEESGDYYLSIPVSNKLVDYEEYYRIPEELYKENESNLSNLVFVAEEFPMGSHQRILLINIKFQVINGQ